MPRQGDESKSKVDPLVDQVVGDPNSPRRSRLLQGFLGGSATEGYVRLYLDPQFSSWVEIPKSSMLATKSMESREMPIDRTFIWASVDAELKWHSRSRSATAPPPTQVECPPFTTYPDCPTITYGVPCAPTYIPYCPAPTDDCAWGGYGRRYPSITLACPPITTSACPPQTIHTDCPTPSYNLPCPSEGPCPTADCPVPTDDCGWGSYYRRRYPTVTMGCPPITTSACPPQTIHTDCPTPSYNLPCPSEGPCPTVDCPAPTDDCGSGGYYRRGYPTITVGCPPITTAACPPQTIHTDCPTPSYNLPCPSEGPCPTYSCPVPTDDCGWNRFRPRGGRSRQSQRFRRLW